LHYEKGCQLFSGELLLIKQSDAELLITSTVYKGEFNAGLANCCVGQLSLPHK